MTSWKRATIRLTIAAVAMGFSILTAGVSLGQDVITPTNVTGTSVFGDWSDIINGAGLSDGGTNANILSETHVGGGGTFALFPGGPDYSDNGGESLTFTLSSVSNVDRVHLWLYRNGTWGIITGFDLEFSTDGGSTFPNSVSLTTAFDHLAADLAVVQSQTFAEQTGVTHIRLSNVDVDGDVDFTGEPAYAGICEIRFGGLPSVPNVALSSSAVASNAAPGTLVGNLSMLNTNGTFTYSLKSSGDYTYFDIPSGSTHLRTAAWIDAASYSISIIGTEQGGGGLVVTNDFTITVDAVADGPPAFVVAANVQNGAADGTVVGTAQTREAGATFSIASGRTDLFYFDGADLKLTNSADWGSVGKTNYVTLEAVVGSYTNELVVAASVVSGATSGTVFLFQ